MSLKTIGIAIALVGALAFLFWDGGSSAIGLNVVVGLLLVIVGVWMVQYDPVNEAKESIIRSGNETVKRMGITEDDAEQKIDQAADKAQKMVRDNQKAA